ncbi:MAG TPA: cytochrome c maturation protein CcmE [Dehalococcoidia bacterium]|nr:cytochrome c maturation protein CcmE [Dehalococcoidia bacterium]
MRKRYFIGGGILAVAVGLLVYASLGSAVSYYLTVSELLDKGSELYGERVRVAGKVANNSIEWDADTLELGFVITEGGEDLLVVYEGARPSGLKEDSNVLVEGEYRSDNTFQASTIILKCPSKYEPEE